MKLAILLCAGLAALPPLEAEVFRPGFGYRERVHRHDRDRSRVHVHVGFGHSPWRQWHHGPRWQRGPYRDWHHHGRRTSWHAPWYSTRHHHAAVYSYHAGYSDSYPYLGDTGFRSAATDGLLLGALAGGIIGHNSGEFRHDGWRGAALGAGLGWVVGSVVDARGPAAGGADVTVVQPLTVTPQIAPPNATARPAETSSAMSAANALFGR